MDEESTPQIKGQMPQNNPMKQWLEKKVFPFKLIIAIAIILSTTIQVILLSQQAVDHSRQFTKILNYYLLGHTSFDYYWMGVDGIHYPYQQYKTLDDFNEFLDKMIDFFSTFNQTTFNYIDQEDYNQKNNSLLIVYTNSSHQIYNWTFGKGLIQPFEIGDLKAMKEAVADAQYMEIVLSTMAFPKQQIQWDIRFSITMLQKSEFMVQILCFQGINLFKYHIPTLICCILIIPLMFLFRLKFDLLDIVMFIVLWLSTLYSMRKTNNITTNLIIDGLTCCLSWLWLPHVFPLTGRFNFSVILRQSYVLIGRLFLAFLPVFIGFSVMAYSIFARLTDKYFTFHRSILQLFYISYYNMTYQTFIITEKQSPLSTIFIIVFIILFTFTIYSSMLVATFCGFAWHVREVELLKDIKSNLIIQCSNCEFKFKYDQSNMMQPTKRDNSHLLIDAAKIAKLKDLQRSRILACYQKIEIAINQLQLLIKKMQPTKKQQYKKMIIKLYQEKRVAAEQLSKKVKKNQQRKLSI